MKFWAYVLTAAILSYAPGSEAQQKVLYTLFVRSGPELVKLLIEKRGDLTIGIIAGAIVTVADHTLTPMLHAEDLPKKSVDPDAMAALTRLHSSSCSSPSGTTMVTCPGDVKFGTETKASDEAIKRAFSAAQSSMLTSDFSGLTKVKRPGSLNDLQIKDFQTTMLTPPNQVENPPMATTTSPNPTPPPPKGEVKPAENPPPADQGFKLKPSPSVLDDFKVDTGSLRQAILNQKLAENTFWMSIQNSAFIPDFEDYLKRYPNGEFKDLAEHRLAYLRQQAAAVPVPPPMPVRKACAETDEAILAPIRFLYRAINNRDMNAFVQPWAQNATYRNYNNTVRMDKQQLFEERRAAFQRWRGVQIQLLNQKVILDGPVGTATVRNNYVVDMYQWQGPPTRDQAAESYSMICDADGLWSIAENITYN